MKQSAIHYIDCPQAAPAPAVRLETGDKINKASLLNALAQACRFPAYFGHNWDSAWDCLCDSQIQHLLLQVDADNTVNLDETAAFIALIEESWQLHGKPQLWLISKIPGLPAAVKQPLR